MINPNTNTSEASNAEQPQQEPITVGMWEYNHTDENNRVIGTRGLGPCIGITTYDPHAKTGYVAHIPVTQFNPPEMQRMWEAISQRSGGNVSDVKVWLRGGQIDYEHPERNSVAFSEANRSCALLILAETGILAENIDIEWDDRQAGTMPGTMTRLDADTGLFESGLESVKQLVPKVLIQAAIEGS